VSSRVGTRGRPYIGERRIYEKGLEILSSCKTRFDLLLHGYVLMTNHVHALIETRKIS